MSDTKTPGEEPAHDILAAEAFALPAPDPYLHHGPVVLPDDPTGIAEPHDVLAAEEFAMPAAPASGLGGVLGRRAESPWRIRFEVAAGALIALLAWRLLRRR